MLTKTSFFYRGLFVAGASGVALVFLFRDFLFLEALPISDDLRVVLQKALRILLTDLSVLLLVIGWFSDREVTRLAIWVQVFDLVVLLPLYLLFKGLFGGASKMSASVLSQLNVLIINPALMILLIPAVYFQKCTRQ